MASTTENLRTAPGDTKNLPEGVEKISTFVPCNDPTEILELNGKGAIPRDLGVEINNLPEEEIVVLPSLQPGMGMTGTTEEDGLGCGDATKNEALDLEKEASFMLNKSSNEVLAQKNGESIPPPDVDDVMDEPVVVGAVATISSRASQNAKMVTENQESDGFYSSQEETAWRDARLSIESNTSVEPLAVVRTQQHTITGETKQEESQPRKMAPLPPPTPTPPPPPPTVGAVARTGPLPSKGLRNNYSAQAARVDSLPPMPTPTKVGAVTSAGPLPQKGLRGKNNVFTQEEKCVPPPPTNIISKQVVSPQIGTVGETLAGQEPLVAGSVPGATAVGVPRRRLGDLKAKGMDIPARSTESAASDPQDGTQWEHQSETPRAESVPGAAAVDVPRRQLDDVRAKGLRNNTNPPQQAESNSAVASVSSPLPVPTESSLAGAVTTTGQLPKKGLRGNNHSMQYQNVAQTTNTTSPASTQVEPNGTTNTNFSAQIPESALFKTLNPTNNPLLHQIELNSAPGRQAGPGRQDNNPTTTREAEIQICRQRSIIEATLINEDMEDDHLRNLQLAEEVDSVRQEQRAQERKQQRFPCWAKTAASCLVLGPLIIVIVVAASQPLAREATGQQDLSIEDTEVVDPLEVYVQSILPEFTLAKLDLKNEMKPSPQTLAFKWLMEDPNLEEYEDWRILQRFAMGTLFFSTDGPNWIENTNWLSHKHHENDWYYKVLIADFEFRGIPGDPFDYIKGVDYDEVTHIWLFNNDLEGTIPPQLSLISSLRSIDFSKNRLRGSLPPELGNLPNLTGLMVPWNDLTGKVPAEYGLWPQMLWFTARSNRLTGTIPAELGMGRFWVLELTNNDVTGTIPSELGQLTELFALFLNNCQLSGTIPSELGLMTSLQELHAARNQLSGPIPSELGNFGMAYKDFTDHFDEVQQIFVPDLKMRAFHDTVVEAFQSKNSNAIHLSSNRLTGTIPTDLARLNFLNHTCSSWLDGNDVVCGGLEFQDNLLSGTIPPLPSSLEYLNVSLNKLTGTISEDLCQKVMFSCSEWLCGCSCECL